MNIVSVLITPEQFRSYGKRMGPWCRAFLADMTATLEDGSTKLIGVTHEVPGLGAIIAYACNDFANGFVNNEDFPDWLSVQMPHIEYKDGDVDEWGEIKDDASDLVKAAYQMFVADAYAQQADLYSDVLNQVLEETPVSIDEVTDL